MPASRDVHRQTTRFFSAALVVIGIVMLVVTITQGGGPLALGVLLGILFVAAGLGRLYLAR